MKQAVRSNTERRRAMHWTEAPIRLPQRVGSGAVCLWCGEREPAQTVQCQRPPCPRCGGWTFLEVGRA